MVTVLAGPQNPIYPCFDAARPKGVTDYLVSRNFLEPNEQVMELVRLQGSRNATMRVETGRRSFVLKQFLDWPPKGRQAPGANERFQAECQFYRTARIDERMGRALPKLLHHDCRATCVILEDVAQREDPSVPQQGLTSAEAENLAWFMVGLHHHSQSVPTAARYQNAGVVGWQMGRLFCPERKPNKNASGQWLERFASSSEKARHALEDALAALEKGGASLIHGDFQLSNWVRAGGGDARVVDAEFSFFGPPEFDAGAFVATLLQGRHESGALNAGIHVLTQGCVRYDARLTGAYTAVHLAALLETASNGGLEKARRAQLMLDRARAAIETNSLEAFVRGNEG